MNMIKQKQNYFLAQYNPTLSNEIALRNSVKAAVQHNLLYSKSTKIKHRTLIGAYWRNSLIEIGRNFHSQVDERDYETLIEALKTRMNDDFGELFQESNKCTSGFRISHAQKSISIYIKYLWCMSVIPEPQICPIDRLILKKTEARKFNDTSWTFVNSIEEHRRKFQYIKQAANKANQSIAAWELINF